MELTSAGPRQQSMPMDSSASGNEDFVYGLLRVTTTIPILKQLPHGKQAAAKRTVARTTRDHRPCVHSCAFPHSHHYPVGQMEWRNRYARGPPTPVTVLIHAHNGEACEQPHDQLRRGRPLRLRSDSLLNAERDLGHGCSRRRSCWSLMSRSIHQRCFTPSSSISEHQPNCGESVTTGDLRSAVAFRNAAEAQQIQLDSQPRAGSSSGRSLP